MGQDIAVATRSLNLEALAHHVTCIALAAICQPTNDNYNLLNKVETKINVKVGNTCIMLIIKVLGQKDNAFLSR